MFRQLQHTYANVVSAADAYPQSNHSTRKNGHAAAVPVVLSHLTAQDSQDQWCTKTCRWKTYSHINFTALAVLLFVFFHKHTCHSSHIWTLIWQSGGDGVLCDGDQRLITFDWNAFAVSRRKGIWERREMKKQFTLVNFVDLS